MQDLQAAARTLGLQIKALNADTGREIDAAFESIGRGRPDVLFVSATPFFVARRVQLVQQSAFHHIPAAHGLRDVAEVGGLRTADLGVTLVEACRQVGIYTGRILKGANPLGSASHAVEQA